MGIKLSNYEKETVILFNEEEREASIYTYNAALQRQLAGFCISHPGQVRLMADNGCGALTFGLPKKWLKVSPPRVLSSAQKRVLEDMNRRRAEIPG